MGLEFTIDKELANISVTLTELASVTAIINQQISNRDFLGQFNQMVATLNQCYQVIIISIQPWMELDSEALFCSQFDARHEAYKTSFLKEASRPRLFVEQAYDQNLALNTFKELKTNYPLLKRTFMRFDEYFDKWIDNDTWLVMSMDTVFKMLNRLLQEIGEFKRKDSEDAYQLYQYAFGDIRIYLQIIQEKSAFLNKFN